MWYSGVFRRHLCDMHIDDWSDTFLSSFSPEAYLDNLKKANVQNAMLYFQSHVGLCYWPTKSGRMHKAFLGRENTIQRLCKMCREDGIWITGYYSLIYNNWAHNEHPDWRMIGASGKSYLELKKNEAHAFSKNKVYRYGLCCPNNPEYRKFVSEQIREMVQYFEFDGLFFDMLYWPHFCYCKYCRSRWETEVGGELPTQEDWNDPRWLLHIEKRREWMGKYAQGITDEVKSLLPNISVEHNYASAVLPNANLCVSEAVSNASDYAGGDLYGGIYKQSFTCKFYRNITKNQPFEYMFSRCTPTLSTHTMTKSEDEIRSAVFLTAAHHGATLVIDALDPIGTMNASVYRLVGKVFAEQIPYEPYFCGNMIEDVGVYYSLRSKRNRTCSGYTNIECAINAEETFVKKNVLCGITGDFHEIDGYKILVASCLGKQDAADNHRFLNYVAAGGNLYLSGAENTELLYSFFGMEYIGKTDETVVYIAPTCCKGYLTNFSEEYPIHFDGCAPLVKGIPKSEIVAKLTLPYTKQTECRFASIHSNPPGVKTDYPMMAFKAYGKGKVFWSALPIEANSHYNYQNIFASVLTDFFNVEYTVISDAPKDVEINVFEDSQTYTVSCTLLNEADIARTVEPFFVKIKVPQKPISIIQLPDGKKLEYAYDGKYVKVDVRSLRIFYMMRIIC